MKKKQFQGTKNIIFLGFKMFVFVILILTTDVLRLLQPTVAV